MSRPLAVADVSSIVDALRGGFFGSPVKPDKMGNYYIRNGEWVDAVPDEPESKPSVIVDIDRSLPAGYFAVTRL